MEELAFRQEPAGLGAIDPTVPAGDQEAGAEGRSGNGADEAAADIPPTPMHHSYAGLNDNGACSQSWCKAQAWPTQGRNSRLADGVGAASRRRYAPKQPPIVHDSAIFYGSERLLCAYWDASALGANDLSH